MSKDKRTNARQENRILISSFGASRDSASEMQRGFRRFARNRPEWSLGWLDPGNTPEGELERALAWGPDGIVVMERSRLMPELLKISGVPKVVVDLHHDHPAGGSTIEIDDEAMGVEVARYFLRNRYEHFAVVVWPGNPPFSALREQGFFRTVTEAHGICERYEVQDLVEQPWHDLSGFHDWLRSLPKPVALYAVQDELAQQVLQACKKLEIRIPLELSLVGMKTRNDSEEGKRAVVSYLQHPFEEAGYRAAELLDEQVQDLDQGKDCKPVVKRVPPGILEERQSTSFRQIPDPGVARAVQYLIEKALKGGTLADAVQQSGVNRRSLERNFRKHMGVSPGEFVRELKMEHARKLLTGTDLKVVEIARECLLTQEHFITVFRETFGTTPHQYRKVHTSVDVTSM